MADELVTDYWLNYKIKTDTVRIWIKTAASGWQLVDELSTEKAVFLSDMLRNEKPIFYIKGVSLHTREEPPGEEETQGNKQIYLVGQSQVLFGMGGPYGVYRNLLYETGFDFTAGKSMPSDEFILRILPAVKNNTGLPGGIHIYSIKEEDHK